MTAERRGPGDPLDAALRVPRPGGRGLDAGAPPRRASPLAPLRPSASARSALVVAAAALLALPERLRNTAEHDDRPALRRQLLDLVAKFEADALALGVTAETIAQARFVLCCFIDEVIAETPWGAAGDVPPLMAAFHEERRAGEKAFELLERLGREPQAHRDLLELFYRCLRLGFEGRYRGQPGGREQLDVLAVRVLDAIGGGGAGDRPLELNPQAVVALRQDDPPTLPVWLLPLLAAAAIVALLVALNLRLGRAMLPAFHRLHALTPALHVGAGPVAAARPRLAPLLHEEIERGQLRVSDEALRSVVSLPADTLFSADGAHIRPAQLALLGRVAQALQGQPGPLAVLGHADNVPLASLQFPSSWHQSLARARAVQAALIEAGIPAQRLRAEGRADAEPVAPNEQDATRALNRRVEIELQLPRPDA